MDANDLRRFFDALGQGDFGTVEGCLHEDVALEFPGRRFGGRLVGRRRVAVFLRQNQRLFRGGLRFEVHWAAALGDRGVVQWTNSGTTRDGRGYVNRGVTVFRFAEGSVVEIQDYLDTERLSETWPRSGPPKH